MTLNYVISLGDKEMRMIVLLETEVVFCRVFKKKGCSRVEAFLKLDKQGPDCVCVVCNRCLYPRSVTEFKCGKNNLDLTSIIHPVAVNSTDYICKTCHNSLKKSCIPVQTVCNKLHIFLTPDELKNLNRLERVLISRLSLKRGFGAFGHGCDGCDGLGGLGGFGRFDRFDGFDGFG